MRAGFISVNLGQSCSFNDVQTYPLGSKMQKFS